MAHTFTRGHNGIREMGEQFGVSGSQCIGLQEGSSTYPRSVTTVRIIHVNG